MSAARSLAPAASSLAPPRLPSARGAYRWFYADATQGDLTLVVIFLVGSPFSRRYAAAPGAPSKHSAVNVAVYDRGQPVAWVLSEYGDAALDRVRDGARLSIGRSALTFSDAGRVWISVDEREPGRRGRRIRVDGDVLPIAPQVGPITLSPGHRWDGLAIRANGSFRLPDLELGLRGRAYLDSNHGDEPLGASLPRWRWTRLLGSDETRVVFRLPDGRGVLASAGEAGAHVRPLPRASRASSEDVWTGWGLRVPRELELASGLPVRRLESSPFYARLEAHAPHGHVMSEVADFRRFRAPWIRWMADFRTRREGRPLQKEHRWRQQ